MTASCKSPPYGRAETLRCQSERIGSQSATSDDPGEKQKIVDLPTEGGFLSERCLGAAASDGIPAFKASAEPRP